MALSAARLTIYAVISAIEEDLRRLIQIHLLPSSAIGVILDAQTLVTAKDRRSRDVGGESPDTSDELLEYIDLADAFHALNANRGKLPESIGAHVKKVTSRLEGLVPIRNRVVHTRPLKFSDLPTALDHAKSLSNARSDVWMNLKGTLDSVTKNPAAILRQQIPGFWSGGDPVAHNLPTPDFDETGFVGRSDEIELVRRAIDGPYPVVTLVGEGGVGKTAVALKAAWDLVDLDPPRYDAIIWATAKTSVITGAEIVRLQNAVVDALGLMQHVSLELAGSTASDPYTEILDYLREFRVLLVLDNLETVLGPEVRGFLTRLPSGSKILLTSRIGVGAYDYPIKVTGMSDGDALQLMRAVAHVRQVKSLTALPNNKLTQYCRKLGANPGFIKWFVAGVQSGRRPEDLLAHPDDFLDFCLSNVYEHLSDVAREALDAMVFINSPVSQAMIAHLTELDAERVQEALSQLLSTSMVTMESTPIEGSYTTTYRTNEIAHRFVARNQAITRQKHAEFLQRKRQLTAACEQISADYRARPYAIDSLNMRAPQDFVIIKKLREALSFCRTKDFGKALNIANECRRLDPTFAEAYRISAFIHAEDGRPVEAREAYEAALELEPQSPRLHYFFGGFMLRYLDDCESAIEILENASKLDPNSSEIQLELARAYLFSHKFEEVLLQLDRLREKKLTSGKTCQILEDLRIQCYLRQADDAVNGRDLRCAYEALRMAKALYETMDAVYRDRRIINRFRKASRSARMCANLAASRLGVHHELTAQASELKAWYEVFSDDGRGGDGGLAPRPPAGPEKGTISRLFAEKNYGFIDCPDGSSLFFHRNHLADRHDWESLDVGIRVSFAVGANDRGPCATNIQFLHEP